jgi:hypothetical protein
VDYVTFADVIRFGSTLRLSMRLYDTHSATLLGQEKADAPNANLLDPVIRDAAQQLFAPVATAIPLSEGLIPGFASPGPSKALNAAIVKFQSDPQGAVVQVDGQLLCAQTPCSKLITFGSHRVVMAAELHERREDAVRVSGPITLDWKLRPEFGMLDITSSDVGLAVSVDGQEVGTTPIKGLRVSAGGHRVASVIG